MEFENIIEVIGRMLFQDVKDLISLGGHQGGAAVSGGGGFRTTSSRRRRDPFPPPVSRFRLIQKALLSRILILLAMSISCSIFPNHNPGDDVFKFQLRLLLSNDDNNDNSSSSSSSSCFCLRGHSCEEPSSSTTTTTTLISNNNNNTTNKTLWCADDDKTTTTMSKRYFLIDTAYYFFLTPLTRWDASRFLQLAVRPTIRDPPPPQQRQRIVLQSSQQQQQQQCNRESQPQPQGQEEVCIIDDKVNYQEEEEDLLFLPSEQAHAFFPFLPIVIRMISKVLMKNLPTSILPSTYEGVVTFSALMWNSFCFVVAALALYELTLGLTQKHYDLVATPAAATTTTEATAKDSKDKNNNSNKKKKLPTTTRNFCHRLSYKVFLLFCINPSSVFFTTAYSEATFAMCNFVGHAIFFRVFFATTTTSNGGSCNRVLSSLILSVVGLSFWMAASYTRSNGSINMAWLNLKGLAMACYWFPMGHYTKATFGILICFLMGLAVAFPIYWHDLEGYQRHCNHDGDEIIDDDAMLFVSPSWCGANGSSSNNGGGGSFSLYGFVQKKHWNVGIFRYYTVMKIPNFLLAGPILLLSLLAVVDWIQASWMRRRERQQAANNSSNNTNNNNAGNFVLDIIGWAVASLAASTTNADANCNCLLVDQEPNEGLLLLGALMLGHYAVLAAVFAVGVLVAHIEITTRMICSSCPAIYWYMAYCTSSRRRYLLGRLILPYCFLFILLGVIMHPNWLPWT